MGQHAPEHVEKGHALTDHDGCCLFGPGQHDADGGQQDDAGAHAPQAILVHQDHAKRRTNGQCAIAGDTVPGDDLGGIVRADPANTPPDRGRAHQAFGAAQHQAANEQADQAQQRRFLQPTGQQHENTAQPAASQAIQYCALAALVVDDATGIRPAQQRRQVLHTDDQPGDHGTKPQVAVHVARQNGQGNTDIQVTDEGEQDNRDDLQRDRHGALGIRHGRIHRGKYLAGYDKPDKRLRGDCEGEKVSWAV
ncbi:hypothetical protein D3C85_1020460 [compost metagenome]